MERMNDDYVNYSHILPYKLLMCDPFKYKLLYV